MNFIQCEKKHFKFPSIHFYEEKKYHIRIYMNLASLKQWKFIFIELRNMYNSNWLKMTESLIRKDAFEKLNIKFCTDLLKIDKEWIKIRNSNWWKSITEQYLKAKKIFSIIGIPLQWLNYLK